jgi:hypothetical protein
MRYVSSKEEIKRNLKELYSYRNSTNKKLKRFYESLLKRGICFVVIKGQYGKLCFGPSMFVGYRNNNFKKHIKNTQKHGTYTNKAIEHSAKMSFKNNGYLENRYVDLCTKQGFKPKRFGTAKHPRRYMML